MQPDWSTSVAYDWSTPMYISIPVLHKYCETHFCHTSIEIYDIIKRLKSKLFILKIIESIFQLN